MFAHLTKLDPGDQIGVRRADGSTVLFEVLRVEQYAKDRFPTDEVYGDIQAAGLRLITCGGDADPGELGLPGQRRGVRRARRVHLTDGGQAESRSRCAGIDTRPWCVLGRTAVSVVRWKCPLRERPQR